VRGSGAVWRAVSALLVIILIGWAVFAAAFPAHMKATLPQNQRAIAVANGDVEEVAACLGRCR